MRFRSRFEEIGLLHFVFTDDPVHQFDGYVDKEATDKKISHDIFTKGNNFLKGINSVKSLIPTRSADFVTKKKRILI